MALTHGICFREMAFGSPRRGIETTCRIRQRRGGDAMAVLRRTMIVAAAASTLFGPLPVAAQGNVTPDCLPHERIECGCSIRLTALACPADPASSRYHLHAGLVDGAPLWLRLDGQEIALKSRRPASQSFSFSRGDRWKEAYAGSGISVDIAYRPGASTCLAGPPEECEYFDVRASVTIARGRTKPVRYEGVGACGC
jgi:hypothetical protein